MKYKLICSDLDDTLLNSQGEIPVGLKSAIANYVADGGKFALVTGRMTVGALPVCHELGLTGELITYQGAVVTDIETGKMLDGTVFSNADTVEICKYLEEAEIYCQTYIGDIFYTKKANIYTQMYGKISNAEYRETEVNLSEFVEKNGCNPPKILIMEPAEAVPTIETNLKKHFGNRFRVNTSKPFLIEIIPSHISKGIAVRKLAEKYGITREEIVCVGDSENDITMLDFAGVGVAVDNASDLVKAYADVIAPSCDDGGILWVMEKFGH